MTKATSEPFVHYIRRWSGVKADETPLCGVDAWERTLTGETHDAAGEPMRICPKCAEIAKVTP